MLARSAVEKHILIEQIRKYLVIESMLGKQSWKMFSHYDIA